MKVVIDTNVLVSAAWRNKFPEAVVIWIAFHNDWDWLVSQEKSGEDAQRVRWEFVEA